jgi:hypothetical protein
MNKLVENVHSAAPVALGFYYQSLYALTLLLKSSDDEGAVSVETLDDVNLKADGQDYLTQLKHSVKENPSPISIKSDAFWKTIKAWIDVFNFIEISDTHFCLVTVGDLASGSPLQAFTNNVADRADVLAAMKIEAERVIAERALAETSDEPLPYKDRFKGCEAFRALSGPMKSSFLSRITLAPAEGSIETMEQTVADLLKHIVVPKNRDEAAAKVVAWWDREVLFSLCKQRKPYISKLELQKYVSEVIASQVHDDLTADFEQEIPPEDHVVDGMLVKQIDLVNGTANDKRIARREEWRARSQRSKWIDDRLDMASKIAAYDKILIENWNDKHTAMRDECSALDEDEKSQRGLNLLRWSYNDAPNTIWTCPAIVPLRLLIYAAFRSKAKGLFQPSAECFLRAL